MIKNQMVMAAAIILGTGSICAADVEIKAEADKPKVETSVKGSVDKDHEYKQEARIESSVKPINKADSIIGMEVRNKNDERLGEVKDIVLDLQDGKISYVALAVGGFLGIGEKLVAVPTSALMPSAHSNNILIMDATRGDIVDAPGFAATNWPDPRSSDLNQSPLWRKNRGSAPGVDAGKSKIYTDAHEPKRSR